MEGIYHFETVRFATRQGTIVESVIEVDDSHPNPYIMGLIEKTRRFKRSGGWA